MKMIKKTLGPLCYKALKIAKNVRNRLRSNEAVFGEIYAKNLWGNEGEFCSGSGSFESQVTDPYVQIVSQKVTELGFVGATLIDVGCGDFKVGSRIASLGGNYLGLDVVEPLVKHNQKVFGSEKISFRKVDAVRDKLPEGDVCFVRQVLQHLSNKEILVILGKLRSFKIVFITEHHYTGEDGRRPNIDKPRGANVRAEMNSGVYITEPPFNIPSSNVELILEVPWVVKGKTRPGIIRTYLYRP